MQCFLSTPLQGNPSLHWMVVASYWCSFCKLGSFKTCSESIMFLESLIIAKHFLFQSFPLLETILVFALIIPSNSAQRNECSWLEWMLSHLSEGLTLGSHTEHFCHVLHMVLLSSKGSGGTEPPFKIKHWKPEKPWFLRLGCLEDVLSKPNEVSLSLQGKQLTGLVAEDAFELSGKKWAFWRSYICHNQLDSFSPLRGKSSGEDGWCH